MTLEILKKRCIGRLTAVPEILYALTRHWFLLTICLGVGSALMVAKVSTDPVVYEGKATLVFNSGDSIVVEQDRRGEKAEDASRLFSSRVDMLQSDSVLRKLVVELKAPNILRQEENTEAAEYGPIRQLISDLKSQISDLMAYIEHPVALDAGQDLEVQRAVGSFRRRSMVVPNPKTNTVRLYLYGNNRDGLGKELQEWIDAYTSRLVEMSEESRDLFFNSRSRQWLKKEEEARGAVEDFKKENPEVSKSAVEVLQQQIVRLDLRRDDLQRELDMPTVKAAAPDDARSKDPEVQSLLAQKLDLDKKILENLPKFGPDSDTVKNLKESLALIEAKLRGYNIGSTADPEARKAQLAEQIEKHSTAIAEARKRLTAMTAQLEQLQALETEYKQAQNTHQTYKLMMIEEIDRTDFRKNVQVQVADRPMVGWQPYNTYPHRQVLYGSCGGLLLGVSLALFRELLSGRVRFKNDIYTEFGVPVVGVIPRK